MPVVCVCAFFSLILCVSLMKLFVCGTLHGIEAVENRGRRPFFYLLFEFEEFFYEILLLFTFQKSFHYKVYHYDHYRYPILIYVNI